MLKRSEVLKANQFVILMNWAKAYCWNGVDVASSISKSLSHITNGYDGTIPDIKLEQAKEMLKSLVEKYVNDIDVLKRDIKKQMETYVVPACSNINGFFEINELPFKTAEEYQTFLRRNVISEF